ncbi:MAG: family transporter [Marmoricola sp.]|nr:family transporter [Marmoricola sp.]
MTGSTRWAGRSRGPGGSAWSRVLRPGRRDRPGQEEAEGGATPAAGGEPVAVDEQNAQATRDVEQLMGAQRRGTLDEEAVNTLGAPLDRRSPFYVGLVAGLGLLMSYGLVQMLLQLTQIITFVLLALFLALGLEPLVALLLRRGLRRGWAVLVVMLGLLGVLAFIGWVVVPTFVAQVVTLVDGAPDYLAGIQHDPLVTRLDRRYHLVQQVQEHARSGITAGTVTSVLDGVLGAGKALLDGVVATVTVLVLTMYLMVALPSVKAAAYKLVPHRRRARVVFLGEEISRRVGGYVLAQTTVAIINGLLTWTMLVVLGLPFSAVLAVLAGLLALIPIVGTLVGGVTITLVALAAGGWVVALVALGYYVAYHVFEAYVLAPRIMHRAVDVPPVITIIAVLAGGALMGVLGALVAIPVAAGLSLIYDQVLVPRQQGPVDTPADAPDDPPAPDPGPATGATGATA